MQYFNSVPLFLDTSGRKEKNIQIKFIEKVQISNMATDAPSYTFSKNENLCVKLSDVYKVFKETNKFCKLFNYDRVFNQSFQ